tara:strand:- start:390 stop:884 length:495 start_codon:yes stop_codon:yes gene_type:complete
MTDLTKTKVYKLTLKEECRKIKGVWMPKVIKLQVNEMNELVQMGKFTIDRFHTITPSMIEQAKQMIVEEYTEREHRLTNLDEITPQEALSLMTDIQIIEEEVVSYPKSIVDDIGYVPHIPTESHDAHVSVMNSIPRMDDTVKEISPNYPTQEEIIAFNRKENSI